MHRCRKGFEGREAQTSDLCAAKMCLVYARNVFGRQRNIGGGGGGITHLLQGWVP